LGKERISNGRKVSVSNVAKMSATLSLVSFHPAPLAMLELAEFNVSGLSILILLPSAFPTSDRPPVIVPRDVKSRSEALSGITTSLSLASPLPT
jgi:hypothetical protein